MSRPPETQLLSSWVMQPMRRARWAPCGSITAAHQQFGGELLAPQPANRVEWKTGTLSFCGPKLVERPLSNRRAAVGWRAMHVGAAMLATRRTCKTWTLRSDAVYWSMTLLRAASLQSVLLLVSWAISCSNSAWNQSGMPSDAGPLALGQARSSSWVAGN
jgi:hypothetical protein